MIDVYSSAYKINVILIIMLKSKVWCDVAELPVSSINVPSSQDFTEYFIEHNVSQKDAEKSFRLQADELLKKTLPAWCSQIPCNKTTQQYCLEKMIHDHCCCDSRHGKEEFPWLPHSCYVGDKCKANIGSCVLYTEIRECCCEKVIVKHWKAISSAAILTIQLRYILFYINLLWYLKRIIIS